MTVCSSFTTYILISLRITPLSNGMANSTCWHFLICSDYNPRHGAGHTPIRCNSTPNLSLFWDLMLVMVVVKVIMIITINTGTVVTVLLWLQLLGRSYKLCSLMADILRLRNNVWTAKFCFLFSPSTASSMPNINIFLSQTKIPWSRFPLFL